MRSYGVIQFAVKDYVPSAVAPAADVHAYSDDRRVTCGVLYIYAHHRVSSAKPLRAYSQTVYSVLKQAFKFFGVFIWIMRTDITHKRLF